MLKLFKKKPKVMKYESFLTELSKYNQGKKPELPKELKKKLEQLSQEDYNRLKTNKNFSRIFNQLKDTFATQKIEDSIKSKEHRTRIRNYHVIKTQSLRENFLNPDPTFLVYRAGVLYRNLSNKKYQLWKELLDNGISVEKIIGVATEREITELEMAGCKLGPGEIIVKSKAAGMTLDLHRQHPNPKINTISTLIKSELRKDLSIDQKMSIVRQVITTTSQIWNLGYMHYHPHLGNWAIEFKNGHPKVTLIDFDMITKIYPKKFNQNPYNYDYQSLNEIIRSFNLPEDYRNKAINLLNRKIKKAVIRK